MKKDNVSKLPLFVDHSTNLACPSCGNGFLHHHAVVIIDRTEDAKTGKVALISGLSDLKDCNYPFSVRFSDKENILYNPSPRRGGIVIGFDCECCDTKPQLGIYQHKGCTVIEWVDIFCLESKPKSQRKPIKSSVRFQILKRDNYRCQMCGVTAKDGATLEIDHILPVSLGGSNDANNLQVLCRDCNAGKSDSLQ